MMILTDRLESVMNEQGLNVVTTAEKAKVAPEPIGKALMSGKVPTARKLINICAAMNVSAEYLLGLTDENKGAPNGKILPLNESTDWYKQRVLIATRKESNKIVAAKTGLKFWDVRDIFSKNNFMPVDKMLKICKAYDVSLDWLLGLSDDGGPEE